MVVIRHHLKSTLFIHVHATKTLSNIHHAIEQKMQYSHETDTHVLLRPDSFVTYHRLSTLAGQLWIGKMLTHSRWHSMQSRYHILVLLSTLWWEMIVKTSHALSVQNKPFNALSIYNKSNTLQVLVYTTTHISSQSFCYHGMLPNYSSPTLPGIGWNKRKVG